jgi:alpha-methylacyl-CoA racemase
MVLAFGMIAALLGVQRGGEGQVIDAAMSDGAALIGALTYGLRAVGLWKDERESNLLDGGALNYAIYECADGRFLAVGAIEPHFEAALLLGLGLTGTPTRNEIAAVIATRSRDEWTEHFQGRDACVAPVLTLGEAPGHPHNAHRGTFTELDGVMQPAPAPRYSGSPCDPPRRPREEGEDSEAILTELGYAPADLQDLRESGAVR